MTVWFLRPHAPAGSPGLLRRVQAGENCPRCRTGTVRHTYGKYGEFLGCTSYPACSAAWTLTGVRIRGSNYGRAGR